MNLNENRVANRRKTLFGGIVYGGNEIKWDCRIIDMSLTGVKLKSPVTYVVGIKVFLRITNREGIYLCETVWANDGFMGLKFLKSSGVDENRFNKTFDQFHTTNNPSTNRMTQSASLSGIR